MKKKDIQQYLGLVDYYRRFIKKKFFSYKTSDKKECSICIWWIPQVPGVSNYTGVSWLFKYFFLDTNAYA